MRLFFFCNARVTRLLCGDGGFEGSKCDYVSKRRELLCFIYSIDTFDLYISIEIPRPNARYLLSSAPLLYYE